MKPSYSCFVGMSTSDDRYDIYIDILERVRVLLPHITLKYVTMKLQSIQSITSKRKQLTTDFNIYFFDGKNHKMAYRMGMAIGAGKQILPILVSDQCDFSSINFLREHIWLHLRPNDIDSIEKMSQSIATFLRNGIELIHRSPKEQEHRQKLIFICYRSIDKGQVKPIISKLREADYPVWFDSWEIIPGDSVPGIIGKTIGMCTHFMIFLSVNTIDSLWVAKELNTAITLALKEGRPRIIPVYLDKEGRDKVPTLIAELLGVAVFSKTLEEVLEELGKAIDSV